jgi:glycosyltransferase involved in cell wall biosynthesis
MMAGKPVLVSSSVPLERIVSLTQSGLVFTAGSSIDLAEKLLTLYKNAELREQLGNNGRKATIQGEMNWEHDQKTLIALYNGYRNSAKI